MGYGPSMFPALPGPPTSRRRSRTPPSPFAWPRGRGRPRAPGRLPPEKAASSSSLLVVGAFVFGSTGMASSGDPPGSAGKRLLAWVVLICSDLRFAGRIGTKSYSVGRC